jgi:hypothetical protein
MSTKCIGMHYNTVSYIDIEPSPFMTEYYNKRMKLWNPYAGIIINENDESKNIDLLIRAIKYVENQ